MKYLQRYLSLLFALVLCVGLFSVTAHAETQDNFNINLDFRLYHTNTQSNYGVVINKDISNYQKYNFESSSVSSVPMDYAQTLQFKATVSNADGSLIVKENENFDFSISGLSLYFNIAGDTYEWTKTPNDIYVGLVNTDGSWTYLYDVDWVYSSGNGTHSIKVSGTAEKDVRKIVFYESTKQYDQSGVRSVNTVFIGMGDNQDTTAIQVEIDSKEVGLLQGIGDKLSSGFSALGDKISSVVNGVLELPQKLWNLISEGLKSLFVPSEESMTAYKDKWDELLASRFGAVYQVVNIMTDSWDGIMQADETDTIEFPQATVNFSGSPFSFGGYSVKIVPDGFGVLVTAIKSIVAIVCTVAFVNGMRKRYDEVMGVEQ